MLRKIRRDKWLPPVDGAWVPEEDICADPLADLGTAEGKLSIWLVDETRSNLNRILCALAGNCDHLSNVDYLLFDDSVLAELQLKAEHSSGNTPDSEANTRWHRDIVEISARRLTSLARKVYGSPKLRLLPRDVGSLLKEAVQNNWVSAAKLNEKLRKKLGLP